MSLAVGANTMRFSSWLVASLLTACLVGDADHDAFWDETSDDTGEDSTLIAAGANKHVATTGGQTDSAERLELLPIGRSENGAGRRVALQLSPADLPKLASGDRLIVPAELQVTTRCDIGQTAPGCNYNPNVKAQLILTGSAGDTSGGGNSKVIATQSLSCTKNEHHCMFVFRPGDAAITLDGSTPCVANNSCYVNLVVWAWSGSARAGGDDKLIIGGNDGNFLQNGNVDSDMARIMAVRERGIASADRVSRESSGSGTKSINTNANPELVYSHRLKPQGQPLKKGEQFLIEARVVADVGGRARFSTELFVTRNPNETDGGKFDKISPASISEQNGFKCSPGSACVTRKVAVFRVDEDINDALFVNVAVRSAVPGGGSTRVTVKKADGWVRAVRYNAAFAQ
jgi:hypothetical protein